MKEEKYYCHICGAETDVEYLCDSCDNYYCDTCSYVFTQFNSEGNYCHECANQPRRKKLTIDEIRDNKLKQLLDE